MREKERCAQAVQGFDKWSFADGEVEAGFGAGLHVQNGAVGEGQQATVPGLGEAVVRDSCEDGRIE